jgi:hypothetical protein
MWKEGRGKGGLGNATHIPILHPDVITTKLDYLVILPWNIQAEIRQQMAHIQEWGRRFVPLIPDVVVSGGNSSQPSFHSTFR